MGDLAPTHPLRRLFDQLRRRGFPLGNDDLLALHAALKVGFGLASRRSLRDTCCALWAKSSAEAQVLHSLFEPLMRNEDWEVPYGITPAPEPPPETPAAPLPPSTTTQRQPTAITQPPDRSDPLYQPTPPVEYDTRSFPDVSVDPARLSLRPFVMVPQYPYSYREVAQTWRRLRTQVRIGAATELDVRATIEVRARTGLATPPILVPRRRNAARILLLVDRLGSMAPYAGFIESVRHTITQTALLDNTRTLYFHDVPEDGLVDDHLDLVDRLPPGLFPAIEPSLARLIRPARGFVFTDPELVEALPLAEALRSDARGRATVVLSDAGATRGHYDVRRVIDSLGLLAALREAGSTVVWLNPVPTIRWHRTSAAAIARHVEMFPLDREGAQRAVTTLRKSATRSR
ncbi:MAG: VWA domain-containing protein [Deltaproteobacteria bacterium]|nr:VWA domain-containing protein [Deltaproteobacteria bacterium]